MQGNTGLAQQFNRGQGGHQQRDNRGPQGGNRDYNNKQGGERRPQGNNSRGPMNNNMGDQNQMQQNRQGGNQGPRPIPQQNAVELPNQKTPAMQFAQSQDPAAAAFYNQTKNIVPSVKADNPHLKQHVGNIIFDYVTQLRGKDLAPKITGMLIDLPLQEIHLYLTNYNEFQKKVHEAANLLQSQMGQAPTPTGMPAPGMPSMPMPGMPGM